MSEFVVLESGIYRTDQILSVSNAPNLEVMVRFINGAEVFLSNYTTEERDEVNRIFRKALLGDKMLTLVEGEPVEDDVNPGTEPTDE